MTNPDPLSPGDLSFLLGSSNVPSGGLPQNPELRNLLRIWILRILVPLAGMRIPLAKLERLDDCIALALSDDVVEDDDHSAPGLRQRLTQAYRAMDPLSVRAPLPRALAENSRRLGEMLGLSEPERRVLEFAVMVHTQRVLDNAADTLGALSTGDLPRVLGRVLGLPPHTIAETLAPDGILNRAGLVCVDRRSSMLLKVKLDLLSPDFAERFASSVDDPVRLFSDTFRSGPPPELGLQDFEHLSGALRALSAYLCRSRATNRVGVNVLLYGPPGTGKTQLARAIASTVGMAAYEISCADSAGDCIHGTRRVRSLRAAQSCLQGNSGSMLIFDESDDVFNDAGVFGADGEGGSLSKAWFNRTLEENRIPTIWISNSVQNIDPAFIRRFDMVLEVGMLPRLVRRELIERVCGDLLTQEQVSAIASSEVLTPGVLVRAASVVRAMRDDLQGKDLGETVCHLVGSTLTAQGFPGQVQQSPDESERDYDLAHVSADVDLGALLDGFRRSASARVCLYGPPGTGKTAFAAKVAHCIGAPLHSRRVSDLVSHYVGKTERNLANAFSSAERDGAVLLLDEVDSLLRDRRQMRHGWEITAANELLQQMEGYGGIFVATTNLWNEIDPAALRRFDLKVRFGPLRSDQAWRLFVARLEALGLAPPGAALERELSSLRELTPGDFATVSRRHRFQPIADAREFLEALRKEHGFRMTSASRPIGFVVPESNQIGRGVSLVENDL